MKHLTNNEIQFYLHGLTSDERPRSEDHFNGCSYCQKRLLLYEKLGDAVVSSSLNPIPKGFEKAVMETVRRLRRLNRITDKIVAAVACIGFAFVGSIVFLTPQLKQIVTKYLMDAWQYGSELTSATQGSTDAIAILVFGAALLVLFAAIDRLTIGILRVVTSPREFSEAD